MSLDDEACPYVVRNGADVVVARCTLEAEHAGEHEWTEQRQTREAVERISEGAEQRRQGEETR